MTEPRGDVSRGGPARERNCAVDSCGNGAGGLSISQANCWSSVNVIREVSSIEIVETNEQRGQEDR